jgi:hypothetical protein
MADGLVIKYKAADNGDRPIANCVAEHPWTNEDIDIVEVSNENALAPKEGVACRIRVKVSCLGAVAFPANSVNVQVWVCNYAAGGVGPLSATAPPYPGPTYPDPDPKSGGPTPISSAVSATTSPHKVFVPWTPQAGELANPGSGGTFHMCIAANAWGPSDGASLPKTVYGIEVCSAPPQGLKNHGQKNITILPASGLRDSLIFPFEVAGSEGEEAFTLEAQEVRDERLGLGEIKTLAGFDFVEVAEGLDVTGIEEAYEREGDVVLLLAGERTRLHPARGGAGRFRLESEGEKGERVKVAPYSDRSIQVRLHARVGGNEEPGAVHAFDVVQRFASGKREGEVVGGARALLVFAPNAETYEAS